MNRVTIYFNKPWNPTVMEDATPLPKLVHSHLRKVYSLLLATTLVSSLGLYSHQIHNIGGWTTTLIFVASITWLSKIQPWRQISRFVLLLAAAYFWGASIGPLINFIVVVDHSDITRVLDVASVFFSCYSVSVLVNERRDLIYGLSESLVTTLVPAWMVISPTLTELTMPACYLGLLLLWFTVVFIHTFTGQKLKICFTFLIQVAWFWYLRHHYSFSLLEFWLIYLLLWPFTITMRTHSQESIYIVSHGENNITSRTIAFFIDFPALTAPRHKGGVMLRNIWGFLRRR